MALFLELNIVIRRHAVDALHLVTVFEETARKMKADETRGACDEKAHAKFLTARAYNEFLRMR